MTETKKEITAEAIKNCIQGKVEAKKMIQNDFQRHNDQMGALVAKNLLGQL